MNRIRHCGYNTDFYLIDGEIVTAMEIMENKELRTWVKNQSISFNVLVLVDANGKPLPRSLEKIGNQG